MERACKGDASLSAGRCTYCRRDMDPTGTKSLLEQTGDHVIPQCRGGVLGEVVPCCWHCNQLKGRKSPEQWEAFMEANPRWWEMPRYRRSRGDGLRVNAQMGARETADFLRRKGLEAALERAQRCTNPFLPIGYTLTDPKSGEALAVLGESRKFEAL